MKKTDENKEFIDFIKKENKNNDAEIFNTFFKNEKIWIKKARKTESSKLHRFYYVIFPFEILIPVQNKTKDKAVLFETSKIEEFQTLNIHTPTVVFKNEEFFALKDCGKNINSYIRKRDITEEKMYYYLEKTIEELSKIHNSGNYHGGAQARNFTYNNGIVCAIDLEDSFDESIKLETLQFRDLILFLISLTKTRASFSLDYNRIIEYYISLTKKKDVKLRLIKLSNKLSWFLYVCDIKFVNNLLGRDVKGFIKLFKTLLQLKAS